MRLAVVLVLILMYRQWEAAPLEAWRSHRLHRISEKSSKIGAKEKQTA